MPACANDWLLQTTLREGWRFEGYVTSDCGAIRDECLPEPDGHGYLDCVNATAASITAGTDVDCGGVYGDNVVAAVGGGALAEEAVDAVAGSHHPDAARPLDDKAAQPAMAGIDDIDTKRPCPRARPRCSRSCCSRTRAACSRRAGRQARGRRPARRARGKRGEGAQQPHDSIVASRARTGPVLQLPWLALPTATARAGDGADSCAPTPPRRCARERGRRDGGALGRGSTATSTTSPPRSPSPPLPTRPC